MLINSLVLNVVFVLFSKFQILLGLVFFRGSVSCLDAAGRGMGLADNRRRGENRVSTIIAKFQGLFGVPS